MDESRSKASRPAMQIAILTFNRLPLLKEAIAAATASATSECEVVVYDNCSTDGTAEYLRQVKSLGQIDRVVRQESNIGIGGNANYVLDHVETEFLLITHDDDLLGPNYVRSALDAFRDNDRVIVYGCGYHVVDEVGKHTSTDSYPFSGVLDPYHFIYHHFSGLTFPWSGTALRTSAIPEDHRFCYDRNPYAADALFLLPLFARGFVHYDSKPMFSYRVYELQTTSVMNTKTILSDWQANFRAYSKHVSDNFPRSSLLRQKHVRATSNTIAALSAKYGLLECVKAIDFRRFFRFRFVNGTELLYMIYWGTVRSIQAPLVGNRQHWK